LWAPSDSLALHGEDLVASSIVRIPVAALERLDLWIEAEGFKGWDPHDGLNSPCLHWARRWRLPGIAILQLLRRSPVNLRPLLGIRKGYNPKAMGLFLATYAQKYEVTRLQKHLELTRFFFNWLVQNAAQGYAGPCWGYNFDWPNRAFLAPAGTPTIVNTAFIGLAFLCADALQGPQSGGQDEADAHRCQAEGGGDPWQSMRGSAIARGACDFIMQNLHTLRPAPDELCFSYTPLDKRFVHNASMLGAWLLAAVYAYTGESSLAEAALAASRFTVRRQRADGSWAYGIGSRDGWVDNFHTGYVLVALNRVGVYLKTGEFDPAVQAGYEFWKKRMFAAGKVPKYYPDQTYPVDIHCVAQAILTFIEFADADPEALEIAERVAAWAIRYMQDPRGFFHYQIWRRHQVRTPYMRWGQAWMQLALTKLLSSSSRGSKRVTI